MKVGGKRSENSPGVWTCTCTCPGAICLEGKDGTAAVNVA